MKKIAAAAAVLMALAACAEPTCLEIGKMVTLPYHVNCPGGQCTYAYTLTGGAMGQNNYTSWSFSDNVIDAPGETVSFTFTGTNEVDSIWLEKELLGCQVQPCTTPVANYTVQPTCP